MEPQLPGPLMRRAARARWADLDRLVGPGGLVVLAPHPDDESLGCGGALAAAAASGRDVAVVVVTDGRRSHRNSASVPPDALAELRRAEVAAAVARLSCGTATLHWLGYRDCEAPQGAAEIAAAAERVIAIARRTAATAVWTTWRGDPHCDHQATALVAAASARRLPRVAVWSYPVWGRYGPRPPGGLPARSRIVRFDTSRLRRVKRQAIAAHRSQMTHLIADDETGFVMPRRMQREFVAWPEIFIEGFA